MTPSLHHPGTNLKLRMRTGGVHQQIPPPHLPWPMLKIPRPALQKLHWQMTPQYPWLNLPRPRRTCQPPRPLVMLNWKIKLLPLLGWCISQQASYPICPYGKRKTVCVNFDSLHGDPEFGCSLSCGWPPGGYSGGTGRRRFGRRLPLNVYLITDLP